MSQRASIHASVVLVGARALLVRGPSGAGKSTLVLNLLQIAQNHPSRFTRLVADDRTYVEAHHGRLLARPVENLAGLLEIRGLAIRHLPFEPLALIDHVVDLAAPDAERLPGRAAQKTEIEGVSLARLAVAPGANPLPLVLAFVGLAAG